MKNSAKWFLVIPIFLVLGCHAQEKGDGPYTFKEGDPYGTGKWYMGREISHVMGFAGKEWLERPEREEEENTSKLLKNMDINPGDTIADIGAGSGYHVYKMADMAKTGLIYGVDIQEKMLDVMRNKNKEQNIENVEVIKGSEKSANLLPRSVDKVLMVDVYHEFSYPVEMMESIKKALRPDGEIYLIEYRGEEDWVPIKKVHKMTEEQAIKEMEAAGFKLKRNIGNLPWQHCMIFIKN